MAQFLENRAQQFRFRDTRIENKRGLAVYVVQIIEELTAKGGFPASDFADEDDETLLCLHPVFQVLHRIAMRGAEKEKSGVGGDVEGRFRQAVIFQIHGAFYGAFDRDDLNLESTSFVGRSPQLLLFGQRELRSSGAGSPAESGAVMEIAR